MTPEENAAIQKRGANARGLGLSEFDCPFYAKDQCPANTGEDPREWAAKCEAWTLGWKMEDAMRSGL